MESKRLSRREFLRGAGATAAAAGEAISLSPGSARATSSTRTNLSDYERYDGVGLAGLVKSGEVSAEELLEAAVERVEQRNPAVNAVINRL